MSAELIAEARELAAVGKHLRTDLLLTRLADALEDAFGERDEARRIAEELNSLMAHKPWERSGVVAGAYRNPATGSYTIRIPKDPRTGKFRSEETE